MKLTIVVAAVAVLIASSVNSTTSLNTLDLCTLVEKDCVGKYNNPANSYQVICKYDKCQPPYVYTCGDDKCTRSKKTCYEYSEMNQVFSSNLYKALTGYTFFGKDSIVERKKYLNQFITFKKNINNCTKTAQTWKASMVCLNNQKTCKKLSISLKMGLLLHNYLEVEKPSKAALKCPCPSSHSYICGLNHCAVSKRACDMLKKEKKLAYSLNFCVWPIN